MRQMQLRWEQLDPRVAAKIGAAVAAPAPAPVAEAVRAAESATRTASGEASTVGATAMTDARPLEPIWSVFALVFALFLVGMYLCVFFAPRGAALALPMTLGPVGVLGLGALAGATAPVRASGAAPTRGAASVASARRRRGRLRVDAGLRDAFYRAELSRAERLYAEIVLLLADERPLGAARARATADLLAECNRLLDSHARLENQRRRAREWADDGCAVRAAETEYEDLRRRAEAEPDPAARAALAQGVALCGERLESVRALGPALSRLEAHQEVVCQALALARASLARRQASPGARDIPDVAAVREAARRAAGEARAEEEALAELARW